MLEVKVKGQKGGLTDSTRGEIDQSVNMDRLMEKNN